MMVVVDVVVLVSMVVVHPLMMVVVVLVVFLSLSGGSGLGENSFVRLVARLKSLRSVDQPVELDVGKPLAFFGHPVLHNVHILHRPKGLKISLQLLLSDCLANHNKKSKQSFFFI